MPSKDDSPDPIEEGMTPEDLKTLLAEIGASKESLRRDAAALREWMETEPHLPNLTSEHDEWLELYLIACKNSMEKVKKRLDNYFTSRSALGDWFVLPPPPTDELVASDAHYFHGGYMPKVLPGGNLLFLEKVVVPSDGDWSRFDMDLHYRHALLQIEAVTGRCKPFRGIVFLMDAKDINMNVASTFLSSLGSFRKVMSCIQGSMPLRVQAIHIVNAPAPNLQRMLLNAVKPLLSDKLGERIIIHSNFDTLHKCIPKEYLPVEYGGTHPTTLEIFSCNLSNFILSKREWYKSREWLKSDEARRLIKKAFDDGIEGSFRKLSVD